MPEQTDPFAEAVAELEGALTPAEVALLLKIHRATVYRMVDSGRLRALRVGASTGRRSGMRIPRSAVARVLRPSAPEAVA